MTFSQEGSCSHVSLGALGVTLTLSHSTIEAAFLQQEKQFYPVVLKQLPQDPFLAGRLLNDACEVYLFIF